MDKDAVEAAYTATDLVTLADFEIRSREVLPKATVPITGMRRSANIAAPCKNANARGCL